MNTRQRDETGQAVVMVTLALVAMCGLIGLAVDTGWMFFVKKEAQTAADAAAKASVQVALQQMGGNTSGFCSAAPKVNCTAPPPATLDCGNISSGNLYNGCKYAAANGFSSTNSRQKVTMQANDNTVPPPTAPGVKELVYWVTVRTVESVPQLFSAVLGNPQGTVAARATAGVVWQTLPGAVYALNREGDCITVKNKTTCGVDINLGGSASGGTCGATICAPGGVVMASGCNGPNNPTGCDGAAGQSIGAATVAAPSIQTRGTAPSSWGPPAPVDGMGNGSLFSDPTTGLSQPPLMANFPVKTCGLPGGQLQGTVAGPYNYYSYSGLDTLHRPIADGNPIVLQSNVTFSASAPCPGILSTTGVAQTSTFPSYFFYGGLNVGSTNATFGPGQYVAVGAQLNGQSAGTVLNVNSGGTLQTDSGAPGASSGDMFILTAPGYPGLATQINSSLQLTTVAGMLHQGNVNISGGATTNATLNGVQKGGNTPSSLDPYNGILFWQDRRNSTVEYNADGTITQVPATATPAQVAANLATPDSPGWIMGAAPKGMGFNGVIYQPRGAWVSFQGHGDTGGSYQLITGAIDMQGGGSITLTSPTIPFLKLVCALIE
jgi:Flp pilus assembly protein TadG